MDKLIRFILDDVSEDKITKAQALERITTVIEECQQERSIPTPFPYPIRPFWKSPFVWADNRTYTFGDPPGSCDTIDDSVKMDVVCHSILAV